jgi:two-component system sensor histidine kinase/response regulator
VQRDKQRLTDSRAALKKLKFALDQHAITAMVDVQGAITFVDDKFCHLPVL